MTKLAYTLATFVVVSVSPAFSQGCGMMGQGASAGGGMMCGRSSTTTTGATQAQPGQQGQAAGGCSCCRNNGNDGTTRSEPGLHAGDAAQHAERAQLASAKPGAGNTSAVIS